MSGPNVNDFTLLRRLFGEVRPYWPHLALVLLLSLLAAPLALLTPVPLKLLVDNVIGGQPLPGFTLDFIPGVVTNSSAGLLVFAVGLLLLITLIQNLEAYGSWLLQLYTGEKLVLSFRAKLFQHIQRLSLIYHDTRGASDSLYRIQSDAPALQYLVLHSIIPVVTSIVTIGAMVWVTAQIDWQLAIVALLVLPIILLLSELYRTRARKVWADVKARESIAMSVVQEVLGAIRVVKAFNQEERETNRFYHYGYQSLRSQLRAVFIEAGFGILMAMTIAGGTAFALFLGVRHVQAGVLSLGDLLVVTAYLAQLYKPLETLSKKVGTLQASFVSAERTFGLLEELPDVPEKRTPRRLGSASGGIIFRNVGFAYDSHRSVLHDISFEVTPGTRVGISGPTGAGKTTLISLLPRFFDPTSGAVLIDGVDAREYHLSDLRRQFALVLQEPVLFSGSIAENIAYGRPGAGEADIIAAAKCANSHEFIIKLPEGYQTPVGDRGMRLSGGERQRISIARAFLRNSPILILDEPTSSVDSRSEAAIMDAMERLMQNRTTFMIAHRLNTLQNCDLRLFLQHGRLSVETTPEPVFMAG